MSNMTPGIKIATMFCVCGRFGSKKLDEYKTKHIDHY